MFKIDKVGFYKNRKGEKVEIIHPDKGDGYWSDTYGASYFKDGKGITEPDIITHWGESTPPKNTAPEGFDHATKRAEYDAKRAESTALHYVSTKGDSPIIPRTAEDVPEGSIPNGGFQGA